MEVRLQATAVLVEVGLVPRVTVALNSVLLPASTDEGMADPLPLGLVEPPQRWAGDAEFRGSGAKAVKSAKLLLVSVQPPSARKAAVAVDSAVAGEVSEQLAAP